MRESQGLVYRDALLLLLRAREATLFLWKCSPRPRKKRKAMEGEPRVRYRGGNARLKCRGGRGADLSRHRQGRLRQAGKGEQGLNPRTPHGGQQETGRGENRSPRPRSPTPLHALPTGPALTPNRPQVCAPLPEAEAGSGPRSTASARLLSRFPPAHAAACISGRLPA